MARRGGKEVLTGAVRFTPASGAWVSMIGVSRTWHPRAWHRYAPAAIGPDERHLLLGVAEAAGFSAVLEEPWDGPAGYRLRGRRTQLRAAVEHAGLADALWARVAHLADGFGGTPLGLNERLRFYAYEAGHAFPPHTDGAFRRPGQESRLTLLLYLNEGYEGGELALLDGGPVLAPPAGSAVLFPHGRWHEGCPVRAGRKVVLRTDVLFASDGCERRASGITRPQPQAPSDVALSEQGSPR